MHINLHVVLKQGLVSIASFMSVENILLILQ